MSGEYLYEGIFAKYTFAIEGESLFIAGPTPAALTVEVFRPTAQRNPVISYTYFTPVDDGDSYYWMIVSDGDCSVSCGIGKVAEITTSTGRRNSSR